MVNISIMNIVVAGVGYVGLVTGLCLAKLGHTIQFLDVDSNKIKSLKNKEIPFYEPDLEDLLYEQNVSDNVSFYDEYKNVNWENLDVFMICVQTPASPEGSIDTSFMNKVFSDLDSYISSDTIICIKSTIHPSAIDSFLNESSSFSERIVFNPEFLKEGTAIYDFFNPDRIIVGSENLSNSKKIALLYEQISKEIIFTDPISSQLIKYLSNSYLPMRLSFANEASRLITTLGGNLSEVLNGVGLDSRIGQSYLRPSPGWGGSCFPKDLKEIQNLANSNSLEMPLIEMVSHSNLIHMQWFAKNLITIMNGKSLKNIILIGASFKENTDDYRHSPSLLIYRHLRDESIKVYIYEKEIMLDKEFETISNFKEDSLVVEMFPLAKDIKDKYLNELNNFQNYYYYNYWEE